MADLWYPRAIVDAAPDGYWGSRTAGGVKMLLHTTEGPLGSYALGTGLTGYYGPGRHYWPNYTLCVISGAWRTVQHIPANCGACALVHSPGGVETNNACTQVEIATKSVDIASLPSGALDELARLVAWEHRVRGLPLTSTVNWVAYPASAGLSASQRLSQPAWTAYSGIVGHQHCPENDHGDPGAFPIADLLSRARALLSPEDVVTEQDKNDIANKVMGLLRTQVFSVSPPIHQGSPGAVVGSTYNKVGEVQQGLVGLDKKVGAAATDIRLAAVEAQVRWLGDAVVQVATADGIALPPRP